MQNIFLLDKIFPTVVIIILIYFWNKYIVKYIVNYIASFNLDNNLNTEKKRTFFINNEKNIIYYGRLFYWFCAMFLIINIWIH